MSNVNDLFSILLAGVDRSTDKRQSFSDFTGNAVIAPVGMIDRGINVDPTTMTNLLQTALTITGVSYLAFINQYTPIDGITVDRILSPDVSRTSRAHIKELAESVKSQLGNEAYGDWTDPDNLTPFFGVDFGNEARSTTGATAKVNTDISRPVNMAVGKILSIQVGSRTIETTLRLLPRHIDGDNIAALAGSLVGRGSSFKDRLLSYNANEINSLWDFMTGAESIREKYRLQLEDPDEIYQVIQKARTSGTVTRLATGKADPKMASHTCIVSTKTLSKIENAMKGRFTGRNAKMRDAFFHATGVMVLMVVDEIDESATIYQSGVPGYGLFTFKNLANVGSDPQALNMNDILSAYNAGNAVNPKY